jgi:hypothetical protein
VDVKESGRHHHVLAQVLQTQVQHFDADAALYLFEILSGNRNPCLTVLDQGAAAASIATEIFTELRYQACIA